LKDDHIILRHITLAGLKMHNFFCHGSKYALNILQLENCTAFEFSVHSIPSFYKTWYDFS